MTMAVCASCGAVKWGALTRCAGCGFEPRDEIDMAKAMVLSDHHLSADDLEKIGEDIAAGKEIKYPGELVENYVQELEENPPAVALRRRLVGCLVRAILFAVAIVLAAWLAFSLFAWVRS